MLETISSGTTDCETPVSQAGTELHRVSTVLASVSGRSEGTVLWQEYCLNSSWCVHSSWYPSLDSEADTASYPHWLKKSHLNHCHRGDQPPPASTHLMIVLRHCQIKPELVSSLLSRSVMTGKGKEKKKGKREEEEQRRDEKEKKKIKRATVLVNHFWMSLTLKKKINYLNAFCHLCLNQISLRAADFCITNILLQDWPLNQGLLSSRPLTLPQIAQQHKQT